MRSSFPFWGLQFACLSACVRAVCCVRACIDLVSHPSILFGSLIFLLFYLFILPLARSRPVRSKVTSNGFDDSTSDATVDYIISIAVVAAVGIVMCCINVQVCWCWCCCRYVRFPAP